MNAPSTIDLLRDVEGFVRPSEAVFLRQQAGLSRGNILNIGTYRGLSALLLAAGAEDARLPSERRVYSVDPHIGVGINGVTFSSDDLHTTYQNLSRYIIGSRVNILACHSNQVVDQLTNIGFAFIDGDHNTRAVMDDLRMTYKVMRDGGIIACHDCDLPSVTEAVRHYASDRSGGIVGSIRWWKVE